jgi:hypothetical protein
MRDKWYEYINQKFFDWRGNTRKTISEFADWLEMPQGQLSQYMRKGGRVPTGQTVIERFVRRFGIEVYEILEIPVPRDSTLLLPEPARSIADEIIKTLLEKNIAPDDPEAGLLFIEIFKEHGFTLTDISNNPSENV